MAKVASVFFFGHFQFGKHLANIVVAPITQYTHVRNNISNTQGSSPVIYLKELLLKERIRSLWEQILSFKRSSHFEKERNCR